MLEVTMFSTLDLIEKVRTAVMGAAAVLGVEGLVSNMVPQMITALVVIAYLTLTMTTWMMRRRAEARSSAQDRVEDEDASDAGLGLTSPSSSSTGAVRP